MQNGDLISLSAFAEEVDRNDADTVRNHIFCMNTSSDGSIYEKKSELSAMLHARLRLFVINHGDHVACYSSLISLNRILATDISNDARFSYKVCGSAYTRTYT